MFFICQFLYFCRWLAKELTPPAKPQTLQPAIPIQFGTKISIGKNVC